MSAQSARCFAILQITAKLPTRNRTFFTRNLHLLTKQEIRDNLQAVSITNPDCSLDDFMYVNDHIESFQAEWTICTYGGNGTQLTAPYNDIRILADVFANGSSELNRIIEDSFKEEDSGKTIIINPYYLAPEDDEEEE